MNHDGDVDQGVFDVWRCENCLAPQYKSLYRQLYYKNKSYILTDSLSLEDYYVIRYFQPPSPGRRYGYSVINKNILGTLDTFEPISFSRIVCEIDHIIDLPTLDPVLMLQKLDLYATFS